MKEKHLKEAYFNNNNNNIINNWSKQNWKNYPISQQPEYIDPELLNEITDKVFYFKPVFI
jgi:3-deoxy-D-arabino-heptulosonate 7-phosphate (DAHP) synthase class II